MPSNLINTRLLQEYLTPSNYGPWFAPFFGVMAKYTFHDADGDWRDWIWTNPSAIDECLAATWDMLGAWNARRAIQIRRPHFERRARGPLRRLAITLNGYGVRSLRDLGQMRDADYQRVSSAIVENVLELSAIKQTARLEPMFGSKVAHHFFPSVVLMDVNYFCRSTTTTLADRRQGSSLTPRVIVVG